MKSETTRRSAGAAPATRSLWNRSSSTSDALNIAQTIGIIATLFLTFMVTFWGREDQRVTRNGQSAEFMLHFHEMLDSGKSGMVVTALNEYDNLDKFTLKGEASEEAIGEFLNNYELLDAAYRFNLVNDDMAQDAFSWDLAKALNDGNIRRYISDSIAEESDLYGGVRELAKAWGLQYPDILPTTSASAAKPTP
jgi:hypothetical protein